MEPPRQEEDVLWRKIRGKLGDMVVEGDPGHCPGSCQSPGARNRERDRGSRQTGSTDKGTRLERYMRQGEVYAGSARNDTQGRQSFEGPQGLPHFPLTLFPVVVSALVSAPSRSNTDVLWRPGREVRSLANAWGWPLQAYARLSTKQTCRGHHGQPRPQAALVQAGTRWTESGFMSMLSANTDLNPHTSGQCQM